MSKFIFSCLIVFCLCLPTYAGASNEHDLNGNDWLQSTENERLAFLYGVSNMIAIEQLIAERSGKAPSIFVASWLNKFQNQNWVTIEKVLTDWYNENPKQANRNVFDVIWFEFLQPQK